MNLKLTYVRVLSLLVAICTSFLLLLSCGIFNNPFDYPTPAIIEYSISGGLAGIWEKTSIDENGLVKLNHHAYDREFIIHYQMTGIELESFKRNFDKADYFKLKNEYKPSHPIKDGFFYTITYMTESKTKTINVEGGANYPQKLKILLETFHETNMIIFSNPDAGTLLITTEFIIQDWPFSDNIKLEDSFRNEVYHEGSEVTTKIFSYFLEIHQKNVNTPPLFWENDYLYEIMVSWTGVDVQNIGSNFYPLRRYPVSYWPQDFGFDLTQISETDIILRDERLIAVQNFLKENESYYENIFIFSELKDSAKAVAVYLIYGQPNPE